MESWRLVWRNGFVPALVEILGRDAALVGLANLARAVHGDFPEVLQGSTTSPPPLACVADWAVEGADPVAFALWKSCLYQGAGGETPVGRLERAFAAVCARVDELIGEPAACGRFLNWSDDTPRDEMRGELFHELRFNLAALTGTEVITDPASTDERPVTLITGLPAACEIPF